VAVDTARRLSDIVIVEAGFGSDLGAEKYFNLVSRRPGMVPPDAVVIVATIRGLRLQGGASPKDVDDPNVKAVVEGMDNLHKHVENMKSFNRPVIVALNRYEGDTDEEIDKVVELLEKEDTVVSVCDVWGKGGGGALELAEKVWDAANKPHGDINYVYDLDEPLEIKIDKIVKRIYGGDRAIFLRSAKRDMDQIRDWGYTDVPVCMAKTQSSLSDNPRLRNKRQNVRRRRLCGRVHERNHDHAGTALDPRSRRDGHRQRGDCQRSVLTHITTAQFGAMWCSLIDGSDRTRFVCCRFIRYRVE